MKRSIKEKMVEMWLERELIRVVDLILDQYQVQDRGFICELNPRYLPYREFIMIIGIKREKVMTLYEFTVN